MDTEGPGLWCWASCRYHVPSAAPWAGPSATESRADAAQAKIGYLRLGAMGVG